MTAAVVALAAALGVLLLVTATALRRLGSMRELRARFEELESRLASQERTGGLARSIELDDVLSRTLEAAGAIAGVDAAVVSVSLGEEAPAVVAAGLGAEGVDPIALESGETAGLSGIAVQIPGRGGSLGTLRILSRRGSQTFGSDALRELQALADLTGPAVENARILRQARLQADLDALTGMHNRRYFHETLAREISRAHRYERPLALIVFDLDDFKAVNDRIGHLAGDAVLAEVAERVRGVVRSADVACRVGGDEFALILPEAGLDEAQQTFDRLAAAVSSRPVREGGRLRISAGIAELAPGDEPERFFERADEALYRAKESGKGRAAAAGPEDAATA